MVLSSRFHYLHLLSNKFSLSLYISQKSRYLKFRRARAPQWRDQALHTLVLMHSCRVHNLLFQPANAKIKSIVSSNWIDSRPLLHQVQKAILHATHPMSKRRSTVLAEHHQSPNLDGKKECWQIQLNGKNKPNHRSEPAEPLAWWPIGYGVGLRIKRSSVRIRLWPLRWVLGQGSLLPLSQGEAFTLASSISYLAILVKYILVKKKKTSRKSDLETKILFEKVAARLGEKWDSNCSRTIGTVSKYCKVTNFRTVFIFVHFVLLKKYEI